MTTMTQSEYMEQKATYMERGDFIYRPTTIEMTFTVSIDLMDEEYSPLFLAALKEYNEVDPKAELTTFEASNGITLSWKNTTELQGLEEPSNPSWYKSLW